MFFTIANFLAEGDAVQQIVKNMQKKKLFCTDHFSYENDPAQCDSGVQDRLTTEKIWGLIHAPFLSCLKTKKPDHLIF